MVIRTYISTGVLGVCFLLVFRALGVAPYEVPTGSMAPALVGIHRVVDCPRCGYHVRVGRHAADQGDGRSSPHLYEYAACPNCGCQDLSLRDAPESPGDRLLVHKHLFLLRRPRRWEIIVFHLFGKTFIKRLIGLPGEWLGIRDGDVYVNGQLARKTLAEFKHIRVPVFDNNYQPKPDGWHERWETLAGHCRLSGTELHLNPEKGAEERSGPYHLIGYRHYLLDEHKCGPLYDECAYNGCDRPSAELVHDFMLECDVEISGGEGTVLLALTDGRDRVVAELDAVSTPNAGVRLSVAGAEVLRSPGILTRRVSEGVSRLRVGLVQTGASEYLSPGHAGWDPNTARPLAAAPGVALKANRNYHVELAFVDRRVSLAIDGGAPFAAVDLPPAKNRPAVVRPVILGARGVSAIVRNVRLFRDVHYTQAGRNAVGGKGVPLAAGQYFVLGDNSPNSEDSRFWPDQGAVPEEHLIGKPLLQ